MGIGNGVLAGSCGQGALFLFSTVTSVLHAIEISPVISARLYGGQYFSE